MKLGEVRSAVRRALNLFDKWNDYVGLVRKHTGYYYELQSIIEDAVHCGIQQALNDFKVLDSEKEIKMEKNKLEVIRKVDKQKCYCCEGKGYIIPSFRGFTIFGFRNKCKTCNGTGIFEETTYFHIVNGICFSGDTLK